MIKKDINPNTQTKGYTAEEMNAVAKEVRESLDLYYRCVLAGIFRAIRKAAALGKFETVVYALAFDLDDMEEITNVLDRKGYLVVSHIECKEENQLYSVKMTIKWK